MVIQSFQKEEPLKNNNIPYKYAYKFKGKKVIKICGWSTMTSLNAIQTYLDILQMKALVQVYESRWVSHLICHKPFCIATKLSSFFLASL